MDCILEHKVDKVGIWLDKLVKHLQIFKISPLLFIKDVEAILVRVKLHVFVLGDQVSLGLGNLFVTLFEFLLLFL